MTIRRAKRIKRELSPDERRKYEMMREQIEGEKPEILAQAKRHKDAHDAAVADLRSVFELLKAERIAQGLSLADLRDRTGMARPALSRLENDLTANPTLATLNRYAAALGKKVTVVLSDGK